MSKRAEDLELRVQNSDIYRHYRGRLIALALTQFEWVNLPDTVNRQYMEEILLTNGSAAWYIPKGLDEWMCTSWIHNNGTFTAYGLPTGITGIDFNARNIETDEFYILYDSMSARSRLVTPSLINEINIQAKLLYEIHQTFRMNLMQQNTPYIVAATKTNLLSVKNLFKRFDNFDPVVEVKDAGFDIEKSVKTLPTLATWNGLSFLEARDLQWRRAINILGLTPDTTKKERVNELELVMNRQEDTISLNARLRSRVDLCNYMNKKYGLDISVNLCEVVAEVEGHETVIKTDPNEEDL